MPGIPQNDVVSFSVHHLGFVISICFIPGDVDLDHLVIVVFAAILHCKVIVFPFVINKYLRGCTWRLYKSVSPQTFPH